MTELGAHVRRMRTEHGWTQAELAKQLGVGRDWVVRLEQGHPRLEAQRVLDALVAVQTPMTVDDEPRPATPSDEWDELRRMIPSAKPWTGDEA